jgi:hypothetical protein
MLQHTNVLLRGRLVLPQRTPRCRAQACNAKSAAHAHDQRPQSRSHAPGMMSRGPAVPPTSSSAGANVAQKRAMLSQRAAVGGWSHACVIDLASRACARCRVFSRGQPVRLLMVVCRCSAPSPLWWVVVCRPRESRSWRRAQVCDAGCSCLRT